ncbi:hypothetical protein Salat_0885400 [Sesamum alatum]|uniref:Uncharacterized protein n=1 Tax=Sesamum alatum TaxID=300844 RepID=A0AAE1YKH4_9LAMI|nr:hypothetical protein Salat_0885400 [Sesamum alatum]
MSMKKHKIDFRDCIRIWWLVPWHHGGLPHLGSARSSPSAPPSFGRLNGHQPRVVLVTAPDTSRTEFRAVQTLRVNNIMASTLLLRQTAIMLSRDRSCGASVLMLYWGFHSSGSDLCFSASTAPKQRAAAIGQGMMMMMILIKQKNMVRKRRFSSMMQNKFLDVLL